MIENISGTARTAWYCCGVRWSDAQGRPRSAATDWPGSSSAGKCRWRQDARSAPASVRLQRLAVFLRVPVDEAVDVVLGEGDERVLRPRRGA